MDFSGFNLNFLSKLLTTGVSLLATWNPSEQHAKCLSLKSSLALDNTTILDVSYVSAGTTVRPYGTPHESCMKKAHISAPLCRVQFSTATSATSAVRGEAWLPDEWYGRFLGLGNGGLDGCMYYNELDYGSALHFATVGTNNGHDGRVGHPFLGNEEVLNDFAFRSIHIEAVIGKQIVAEYYGRPHAKAYYIGCSTGGRQGTQTALKYPEDFDGIIAGAPATDFNRLLHWAGTLSRYVGAPNINSAPTFITPELWKFVAQEILNQCDGIDGVVDGIITEPDACEFRPEELLCDGNGNSKCLTRLQVEALRKIYSPLYGNGELIYPRFDPGSEGISPLLFAGKFPLSTTDWLKYAVLNTSDFDFSEYGPQHGRLMDDINPGGIATFDGDFSAFRDRGGKFLTYHGRGDPLIPSGNSKRVYDLVARTLGPASLDAFYRLFLVPGMGHCKDGPGAARFGQLGGQNAVNASAHNVLLALVDWVEGGMAPDTIIGTAEDGATRVHCRYPQRSIWDGGAYVCEE
ncbi:tannase and feruloyl esterase [Mycena rosella]|uniref:Carboxylic ester hydrolase n=1 Tax=Mycena rosella TaxID=1033263 RepID=A0AAD7GHQ1_MYCRO|nr:tannase and feruloyl esterase [Mycena rosella]